MPSGVTNRQALGLARLTEYLTGYLICTQLDGVAGNGACDRSQDVLQFEWRVRKDNGRRGRVCRDEPAVIALARSG